MFEVWTGGTGTRSGLGSVTVTREVTEMSKGRWTGVVTGRDWMECSSTCIAVSSPTVPSLSPLEGSSGIKPYGWYFCPYCEKYDVSASLQAATL